MSFWGFCFNFGVGLGGFFFLLLSLYYPGEEEINLASHGRMWDAPSISECGAVPPVMVANWEHWCGAGSAEGLPAAAPCPERMGFPLCRSRWQEPHLQFLCLPHVPAAAGFNSRLKEMGSGRQDKTEQA